MFRIAIDSCSAAVCVFGDFANYYYPMGEAIFRTGLPIKGFVYSPFIAILLAVFPPLGFDASLILWGCLQAAFIILYFLCFRWLVPASLTVQLLFVALTLASFPILHNLAWGQVGIFTTVSILGALVLYERGHRAAAAALLAFGISFQVLSPDLSCAFRAPTRYSFPVSHCGRLHYFPLRGAWHFARVWRYAALL